MMMYPENRIVCTINVDYTPKDGVIVSADIKATDIETLIDVFSSTKNYRSGGWGR